ncbi:MAG TPA: hypothetical protein VMW85_02365 [Methanomassiliicoccales archaeon]|nr:hypothetical protein [Methanomassiliicoccales archaeon]
MFKYEYKLNWAGEIYQGTLECENNEDSKREVKQKLKEIGAPKGKYIFVDIIRLEDNKIIVSEELWMA